MPTSTTRRTFNALIYFAMLAFVSHYADQALSRINQASTALENIRSR